MNKQKGFLHISGTDILVALCVVGIIGWCSIELILWLLSFVHVSFGSK